MRNLAGNPECDKFIKQELERARIPVELAPDHRSEVPYTLMGRLGNIAFRRAWYYWVTDGLVPIETADILYADPIGKTDIRVAGHAGAPAPQEWAEWITPDGLKVYPSAQETEYLDFLKRHPNSSFSHEVFSDNPEVLGARQGITTYHIDTEAGLRVFADTFRAHALINELA